LPDWTKNHPPSIYRYDHFGVLAELLPSALPSLAIDLVTARDGYFNSSNQPDVYKALECVGNVGGGASEPFDLESDPYLFDRMSWCYFPGAAVYKMIRDA
jgi:hexosaminidase